MERPQKIPATIQNAFNISYIVNLIILKHEDYKYLICKDCFFATAKTHKSLWINEVNLDQSSLHPIIDQNWTWISKLPKVTTKYLSPLARNDYTIRHTLSLSELIKHALFYWNYDGV